MKLITFLACIMMGLSIWSITARAQTAAASAANAEPAGTTAASGDSFPGAVDCPVCQKNMKNSSGCQTGFNSPTCERLFDGPKGKETAPKPNDTVQ